LWLIVGLQALLMIATTILYLPFQEPDEIAHVDYVIAHREGVWLAGPGQRPIQSGIEAASTLVPDTQSAEHVGGTPVPPRGTRESFDELGRGPSSSPITDQMVQHPPLYYGLAAGFSYLLPDFSHRGFDVQVLWLRLLSLLLLLPVPILIFTAAKRITANTDLSLVATLIPLSIPSYLRTGASVTNDSLLILLTTALLALLARVAWGDRSGRVCVLAGVTLGAALLTKGFALALPVVVVVAYFVGAGGGSITSRIRFVWRPLLGCLAIGTAIGAWWWIRNLVVYSVVQPDGYGPLPPSEKIAVFGPDTPPGSELKLIPNFLDVLLRHIWGSLGLIDSPTLPFALLLAIAGAAAVLAAISLGRRDESIGWYPARAVVLLLPVVLTAGILYVGVRHAYLHGQKLPGLQARYLLPDVLGAAICIAVALGWLSGRARRWLAPVVLTATLLFLFISTFVVLDVEMSPPESGRLSRLSDAVRFLADWAPWSGALTITFIVALLIVGAATLIAFWRSAATNSAIDAPAEIAEAASV
jgi:4-amino-4-deoxy-L-arabinose transferase-like glycosyltransferase